MEDACVHIRVMKSRKACDCKTVTEREMKVLGKAWVVDGRMHDVWCQRELRQGKHAIERLRDELGLAG